MSEVKSIVKTRSQIVQGENYRFTLISSNIIRLEYSSKGIGRYQFNLIQNSYNFKPFEYTTSIDDQILKIDTPEYTLSYFIDKVFSYNNLTIYLKKEDMLYRFGMVDINNLKGLETKFEGFENVLENGLFSKQGFTIYNNSSKYILENDLLVPNEDKNYDFYFFIFGHQYLKGLQDFFAINQKPKLLSKKIFGNIWNFNYQDIDDLKMMVNQFNQKQFPIDMIINNFYFKLDGQNYSFKEYQEYLKEKDIEFLANVFPLLNDNSIADNRKLFDYLENKIDVKYNVDNNFFDNDRLNQDCLSFDAIYHQKYHDSTNITMHNCISLGSHRFPITTSNFDQVTWKTLENELLINITSSLVGVSYLCHTIGGYYEGIEDDELYIKWLQLGVVSPIMKVNSYGNEFPIRIPFLRENIFLEYVFKKFMNLRSQLISYIYTMSYFYVEEGIPIIRPLYFYHQVNKAYEYQNYYFGENLIAAPCTSKSNAIAKFSKVKAYLPRGKWYDYFTNQEYRGNRVVTFYPHLDELVLLAKSGAVIAQNYDSSDIHFLIFKGRSGQGHLYIEEDGIKNLIEVNTWSNLKKVIKITVNSNQPSNKNIFVFELKGVEQIDKVSGLKNCRLLEVKKDLVENKYLVKVLSFQSKFSLIIRSQELYKQKKYTQNNIYKLLLKSNIENEIKNAIAYQLFSSPKTKKEMLEIVKKIKVNKYIKSMLSNVIKQ